MPVIHALIPARSGSKGIRKKNIKIYKNYPLIAYTIQSAINTELIDRVVVSTDSKEIQEIAIKYGAEAPFLRPSVISGDLSPDIECFKQYISWLRLVKEEVPDIIVHLRPTYPERDANLITDCLETFLEVCDDFTSLRTVVPINKSVFKMYLCNNNTLYPMFGEYNGIKEPHNQVRQILPKTYLHNGCVDIINTQTIINNSMTGNKIFAYIMPKEEVYDIDTEEDWKRSERKRTKNHRVLRLMMNSKSLPIDINSGQG
jgi:CMP-N-acetylneuraminic acid synthetase